MKRSLIASALLFLACALAFSQTRENEMKILDNELKCAYGFNYTIPFDVPALSKAPKGYQPFYIAHYGRHGSRYAWNRKTYTQVNEILTEAAAAGELTELGMELQKAYVGFVEKCEPHTGELTKKGWEQHKEIARRMYKEYPQIFKHDPQIDAAASSSYRAIMSMSAFCVSLAECNRSLDIYEQVSPTLYGDIIPDNGGYAGALKKPQPQFARNFTKDEVVRYMEVIPDWDGIMARLFKDPSKYEDRKYYLVQELYTAYVGLNSLDFEVDFPELFTARDFRDLYEHDCVNIYRESMGALKYAPILDGLIDGAENAIASERPLVKLRFGHDYIIQQYLILAGVGVFGVDPTEPEEIMACTPAREIPMGANVQFVFYRSPKSDVILVKPVLNGRETTLPCTPVEGCYYDWAEYKAWLEKVLEQVDR